MVCHCDDEGLDDTDQPRQTGRVSHLRTDMKKVQFLTFFSTEYFLLQEKIRILVSKY